MKAKIYYANHLALTSRRPTPNHLNVREGEGDVAVKVIKSSDVEKLVEKAARATAKAVEGTASDWRGWAAMPGYAQDSYRDWTRVAFKAIGLLP